MRRTKRILPEKIYISADDGIDETYIRESFETVVRWWYRVYNPRFFGRKNILGPKNHPCYKISKIIEKDFSDVVEKSPKNRPRKNHPNQSTRGRE